MDHGRSPSQSATEELTIFFCPIINLEQEKKSHHLISSLFAFISFEVLYSLQRSCGYFSSSSVPRSIVSDSYADRYLSGSREADSPEVNSFC